MSRWTFTSLIVWLASMGSAVGAYPLYGSDERAIGRLEADRLIHEGTISGRQKLPGELLTLEQVDIRLSSHQDLTLPRADPTLSAIIKTALGERRVDYAVAVLDLTDPDHVAYAADDTEVPRALGSIGKALVALALFQALADVYPDDQQKRLALLGETIVIADQLAVGDPHKVRMWNTKTQNLRRRALQSGDRATLWDYLDWMLSASSNAAANVVMQQAMLLNHFGRRYPVTVEQSNAFFLQSTGEELSQFFQQTFVDPLKRNGLDESTFRQGSFFGRGLRELVPGTPSHASAQGILMFLLRLEQGLIVDPFSSTEIKRLLYVTERRVRYAASPALREAAVYFKSGSLFACEPQEGAQCRQFFGDKLNVMNSMGIVESPADDIKHFYLVALMSNVLGRNSALDHQAMATRIHTLIVGRHE